MLTCALAALLLAAAAPGFAQSAPAFATPGPCEEGAVTGGARSLICVPRAGWNGSLVVHAHGYVSPLAPLTFGDLQLADGTKLPDLVQRLGFAFATTTYRQNGLAILDGVQDVVELVKAFKTSRHAPPSRIYITGVSEGGLVAALAAEQYPDVFTAAFSSCGPVAGLLFQITYVGDVRVLFDAFFPGILPGSPVQIPGAVISGWDRIYLPAITKAVRAQPARARELLNVARVPFDTRDDEAVLDAITALLWHNVFGTNDARAKLGGNPYGNRLRWYSGSSNDTLLNLRVQRIDADAAALSALRAYAPAGDVRIPVVTLHTTGDPVVPYAHELVYGARSRPSGRGGVLPLPVFRYGHCAFTTSEVLTGFALMLGTGLGTDMVDAPVVLAAPTDPQKAIVSAVHAGSN